MIKLKGNHFFNVSSDGKYALSMKNGSVILAYDVSSYEIIGQFKALSNTARAVMSHNGKYIATKNTSGTIIVLEFPSGRVVGKCPMKRREGFDIWFSKDDSYIIDIDWDGNVMKLDLQDFKCRLVHSFNQPQHVAYGFYDEVSNNVDIIIIDGEDNCVAFSAQLDDKMNFAEKKLPQEIKGLLYYDVFMGKICNIIFNFGEIYRFDKSWEFCDILTPKLPKDLGNAELPAVLTAALNMRPVPIKHMTKGLALSDNEKMLFVIYQNDTSFIFDVQTMEAVKEYNFLYSWNAKFMNNDSKIAISTWLETYVDDIK